MSNQIEIEDIAFNGIHVWYSLSKERIMVSLDRRKWKIRTEKGNGQVHIYSR
jgi:hypothetical protein